MDIGLSRNEMRGGERSMDYGRPVVGKECGKSVGRDNINALPGKNAADHRQWWVYLFSLREITPWV